MGRQKIKNMWNGDMWRECTRNLGTNGKQLGQMNCKRTEHAKMKYVGNTWGTNRETTEIKPGIKGTYCTINGEQLEQRGY
jgi:hypothetical protein